ncbi:hypothetical protein H6P81_014711 [Aristolochia fimbriata]|uniref:Secreted protein n=1 Tax=Aristolochia fimbriata TaxID=158543 RepID=A0AAV7E6C8_ARIFI|nr:hypothetical protein H6P81_014711 [Aristolochia fimbriata]
MSRVAANCGGSEAGLVVLLELVLNLLILCRRLSVLLSRRIGSSDQFSSLSGFVSTSSSCWVTLSRAIGFNSLELLG